MTISRNTLHEVVSDLLRTDSALLLAGGPSVSELAAFLDGLADVQLTLDDVRAAARRRFTEMLDEGRPHSAPGDGLRRDRHSSRCLPAEAERSHAGRSDGPGARVGPRLPP